MNADAAIHLRLTQNINRSLAANAVDIGQGNVDPLVTREINTSDTCHFILPLPLLVPRVLADDSNHASAPNHLTLLTHLLHGSSHFHRTTPPTSNGTRYDHG